MSDIGVFGDSVLRGVIYEKNLYYYHYNQQIQLNTLII